MLSTQHILLLGLPTVSPLPVPAIEFIEQFQSIYFACHRRHHRDVPRGRIISEQQLHVLGHLDRVRATRVGELATHMGLSHSSVSLTIDRLQRDGYVTRERSDVDARVTLVRLTDAGEEVRDAQRVLEPELVDVLFDRLSPEERQTARDAMAAIARVAKEMISAKRTWKSQQTVP
jgi:MarR family transcriptional regulator, organic hydroperoxide resistance regulator